jgi:SAM-dependent methyltransferase
MVAAVKAYVTDVVYVRAFFRELAPAWLDLGHRAAAARRRLRLVRTRLRAGSDDRHDGGDPSAGRFVGIDLMPEHIDHARRLAAEAGVGNVSFHAGDFADEPRDQPRFDYIVAHGVYSWVGAAVRAALRRFIDRHLRPGGLAYLSYNAMPGWAIDLPFQRLVFALARDLPGDSAARFSAAAKAVRILVGAGAASLTAGTLAPNLDELEARLSPAYLVHEYMVPNWQPLFVTEVLRRWPRSGWSRRARRSWRRILIRSCCGEPSAGRSKGLTTATAASWRAIF